MKRFSVLAFLILPWLAACGDDDTGPMDPEPPDPAVEIQVNRIGRPSQLKFVLSNSFGFGGNNATVILGARS